jgi:hypothetical protein
VILVIGLASFLRSLFGSAAAVALENLALRHQFMVLQRSVARVRQVPPAAIHGCVCARLPLRPSHLHRCCLQPGRLNPAWSHRDTGADEVSNRDSPYRGLDGRAISSIAAASR